MAKNNRNVHTVLVGYIAGKKDGPNAVIKSYPARNGQEAREYGSVFINVFIGDYKAAINVEIPAWQVQKVLMVDRSSMVSFRGDLTLTEKNGSPGNYWWNLNNAMFLGELHDDRNAVAKPPEFVVAEVTEVESPVDDEETF